MDSNNQENSQLISDSSPERNQVQSCPKCNQTYAFLKECPTCLAKEREMNERSVLLMDLDTLLSAALFSVRHGSSCSTNELKKMKELLIKHLN